MVPGVENKGDSDAGQAKETPSDPILRSLTLIDSVLQFLAKATGQSMIPLKTLMSTVPSSGVPFEHISTIVDYGILQVKSTSKSEEPSEALKVQWLLGKECNSDYSIGFPDPDEKQLSGTTKTAAKRRLAALKRKIKQASKMAASTTTTPTSPAAEDPSPLSKETEAASKDWSLPVGADPEYEDVPVMKREREARKALEEMLGLSTTTSIEPDESKIPTRMLPKQLSYGGTHESQVADYDSENLWKSNVDSRIVSAVQRSLYRHQAVAIQSALQNIPTLVCTGTGSGKSLCFMIPVLNAALQGERSLLLFPTKALAQDQLIKLQTWLREHGLDDVIQAATLDGDTPHSQRVDICTSCNVILTNPDTLHAAIMPNWKHLYRNLLSNLHYVVIDEAHMYRGVFGAHVSMILARLYRLVCLQSFKLCFLACSATLAHPEHHFRLLCCIPRQASVNIVKHDGSPRADKHFLVWNPPLLDMHGKSLGVVKIDRRRTKKDAAGAGPSKVDAYVERRARKQSVSKKPSALAPDTGNIGSDIERRRHSADETALLLALAVIRGVRTIAFCKTRSLVEWIYDKTIAALKKSPKTADLCTKVESYRGGYTKIERRQIEERLFNNQLLGVVGTSALELGVDIGGVDLTLHCGFPSSHENLIQQSGRAGRGKDASTSLAICVCFNSPLDQHLWRHPAGMLSRGLSAPLSMPIYPGLVQGHLLCAGQEFPLSGSLNTSTVQSTEGTPDGLLADEDLFGSKAVYEEALGTLLSNGSMVQERIRIAGSEEPVIVHSSHPSMKNPWTHVSIRSIEAVTYQIVDLSHPKQGGRTDAILDNAAVLDSIPYSRVFYHAYPGAILLHRGQHYKVACMNRPPAFGKGHYRNVSLGAFARPCNPRYSTLPLSGMKITIVKQMERVDDQRSVAKASKSTQKAGVEASVPDISDVYSGDAADASLGSFAGCGVVTVKRHVHGFKKLSIVTRKELSRSELSLPDMEFDSFAMWFDCDAGLLSPQLGEPYFGYGVHALSHAILAVAPLFVPCIMADVQCDHRIKNPTRVTIFDSRAGGSGICAQLWKAVFIPNGLIEAAIDLLDECPSCSHDKDYDGGCPACLQANDCIEFNKCLSKSSGLVIGRRLLQRLKACVRAGSEPAAETLIDEDERCKSVARQDGFKDVTSLRRTKREQAMRNAKDIVAARDRQVVVGRPSWPLDPSGGP